MSINIAAHCNQIRHKLLSLTSMSSNAFLFGRKLALQDGARRGGGEGEKGLLSELPNEPSRASPPLSIEEASIGNQYVVFQKWATPLAKILLRPTPLQCIHDCACER